MVGREEVGRLRGGLGIQAMRFFWGNEILLVDMFEKVRWEASKIQVSDAALMQH